MPNVELQARVREQKEAEKVSKLKYRGVTYKKQGKQVYIGGFNSPLTYWRWPYGTTFAVQTVGIDHIKIYYLKFMARTSFTGTGALGFSNVLYVTANSDDQWFIPGNQSQGDNPDSGTMANRVDNCEALVGVGTTATISNAQIGKDVQPKTLNDW